MIVTIDGYRKVPLESSTLYPEGTQRWERNHGAVDVTRGYANGGGPKVRIAFGGSEVFVEIHDLIAALGALKTTW